MRIQSLPTLPQTSNRLTKSQPQKPEDPQPARDRISIATRTGKTIGGLAGVGVGLYVASQLGATGLAAAGA